MKTKHSDRVMVTASLVGLALVGFSSQAGAVTPIGNTKFGLRSLTKNTGDNNTALGFKVLNPNADCISAGKPYACCTAALAGTCGVNSSCSGPGAPFKCCTGLDTGTCGNGGAANTGVGEEALKFNTTGFFNSALGFKALRNNTTGANNTALGMDALALNTGSGNIGLGFSAGVSLTTGANNIDIGNTGVAGEGSTIRIGTAGTQTATFIAGINGATSSGGTAVFVDSNGQLGTITSSARFKDHIQDMGDSTSALMKLRPVRFRYKKDIDPSGLEQYGLVAEEVAKVYPTLVVYDDKGQPQTVRYHFVNAMLLNEVQKQARQLSVQRQQLTEQARQMKAQAERVEALTAQVHHANAQAQQIEALAARLVQLEATVGGQKPAPAIEASYTAKPRF